MRLSEYLNAINYNKDSLLDDEIWEKEYVPFIINRCLSYFPDTILHSNEVNLLNGMDKKLQFDYLRLSLRKRKRFSKWQKQEKSEDLDIIKKYFNYSNQKAKDALRVLTPKQISKIREYMSEGGPK